MKQTLTLLTTTLILGLGGFAHATAPVTGQWDFNSGDLSATVGTPLAYLGSPATTFTTMTINGQTAKVMGYPQCADTEGYIMTHGIAPNGGIGPDGITPATRVNQYTLIMDIMIPAANVGWHTLLQTDTNNINDGQIFISPSGAIRNYGVGHGYVSPDTWHRVVCVVDLSTNAAATGTNWLKYIDGAFVGSQGNVGGLFFDADFSLQPTALLFTDDPDGDTNPGFVSSIQIRNGLLTDQEILNLGGPTAGKIPNAIPTGTVAASVSPASATDVVGMTSHPFNAIATLGSGNFTYQWFNNGVAVSDQTNAALRLPNLQPTNAGNYTVVISDGFHTATNSPAVVLTVDPAPATQVTGQWDFSHLNSAATYGQPLVESDPSNQIYDTTTSLGISDVAGQPANVMECYASTGGGYVMTHGIDPNGGGTYVNQYTVIMDLLYPFTGWSSLWQTDLANTTDGDIFFDPDGGLGISGQYDGALTAGDWHRVVLAFDLTKSEFGKYIDGTNVVVGASGLHNAQGITGVDGRWSLYPTVLLLADNDGEVMPVFVSSVQIRSGRMTDAAVAALGAPTAYKIPGIISASSSGGNVVINWTGTVLQSAPSVTGPWSAVSGAGHPYTITTPVGNLFFRPAQQ